MIFRDILKRLILGCGMSSFLGLIFLIVGGIWSAPIILLKVFLTITIVNIILVLAIGLYLEA